MTCYLRYERRWTSVSGSELFWSSGTWLFLLGQASVIVLAVGLYFYLGKREADAVRKAGG